jgi:hypothetical protein
MSYMCVLAGMGELCLGFRLNWSVEFTVFGWQDENETSVASTSTLT